MFFDIGWTELLVIGMVALIVVGPQELPGLMRTIGKFVRQIKQFANQFKGEVEAAVHQSELGQLRSEITDLKNELTNHKAFGDIQEELDELDRMKAETWSELEFDGTDGSSPEIFDDEIELAEETASPKKKTSKGS